MFVASMRFCTSAMRSSSLAPGAMASIHDSKLAHIVGDYSSVAVGRIIFKYFAIILFVKPTFENARVPVKLVSHAVKL